MKVLSPSRYSLGYVPTNNGYDCKYRLEIFSKLAEKKQAFNAYKIQKMKDEKEDTRLSAIKNKEDLETFLMSNPRLDICKKKTSTYGLKGAKAIYLKRPVVKPTH